MPKCECSAKVSGHELLSGEYAVAADTFHDRPTFRRADDQYLIYYYDTRDGEENSGWWLGKELGGDLVHAR